MESDMEKNRKYLGSFSWPFYRYDVLMPEPVTTDLFEWLYLSFIVMQNRQMGLSRESYRQEEKDAVRHMIKERFASLLDDSTYDNIVASAERDFVVNGNHFSENRLADETFSFLDTYDDLFSSQVSVQRIFQDAICGEVIPCFSEEHYRDAAGDKMALKIRPVVKDTPTQTQILKAYSLYHKLISVGARQEEIVEVQEEDPDAEVDFQFSVEEPIEEKDPGKKLKNFSTHFIDNSKCEFRLEIPVYSDGEKIFIGTPFDADTTDAWMNKLLKKARSICSDLDGLISGYETENLPQKKLEDHVAKDPYVYGKGVADQLTKCGDLYRLIEHLPPQLGDLKKYTIEIDKFFVSKYREYFNTVGQYLECLINAFADRTDKEGRQYFDYVQYCSELNYICNHFGVNSRPLCSKNIFENWQKAWNHFKADVANLFISNAKMRSNMKLYPEFIQDIFDLYDKRNVTSHYSPGVTLQYDEDDIKRLYKITRVFVELI